MWLFLFSFYTGKERGMFNDGLDTSLRLSRMSTRYSFTADMLMNGRIIQQERPFPWIRSYTRWSKTGEGVGGTVYVPFFAFRCGHWMGRRPVKQGMTARKECDCVYSRSMTCWDQKNKTLMSFVWYVYQMKRITECWCCVVYKRRTFNLHNLF